MSNSFSKHSLMWRSVLSACICSVVFSPFQAQAVEKLVNSTVSYNTTPPTSSDIPNWNTGWGTGVTGWDYVGTINGASGVYLGNGWVLTAAHVGAGAFTLGANTYSMVNGSTHSFFVAGQQADFVVFQLATSPILPALSIANSAPVALGFANPGDQVAMLGFGGGQGETWGLNTVTQTGIPVNLNSTYQTTDFETVYGVNNAGLNSATNNYVLVEGDSGGADFIYNSSAGRWELAGINEAVNLSNNDSFMVQLSTYSSQINSVVSVPEPSTGAFAIGGLLLLLGNARRARWRKSF